MPDTMAWISLRAPIKASTSAGTNGNIEPVTAGAIVRIVELRLPTISTREALTVGTIESVTSDFTTVAIKC